MILLSVPPKGDCVSLCYRCPVTLRYCENTCACRRKSPLLPHHVELMYVLVLLSIINFEEPVMDRCILTVAALTDDVHLTSEPIQELRVCLERRYASEAQHLTGCAHCLPRKALFKILDTTASSVGSDDDFRPMLVDALRR